MALGITAALLAPATVAQAEPDRHPMDPLGANFGPALPQQTQGDGPRTPRQPDVDRPVTAGDKASDTTDDKASEPQVAREDPVAETHQAETDDGPSRDVEPSGNTEPRSGGSVADRIAQSWPGDDAKAIRVVRCESGLNPSAYNPAGPYYGLWQFDVSTWRSVGGSGLPSEASVEEQTRRAWDLRSSRGWAPWPVCGKS